MLLAHKDESRRWMSIDRLAGRSVMLTVAILSMVTLNVSNALSNEGIQSTSLTGLLGPRSAVWEDGATVRISKIAFFAASRAASTAVTSCASIWADGFSWFIHIRVWMENWT